MRKGNILYGSEIKYTCVLGDIEQCCCSCSLAVACLLHACYRILPFTTSSISSSLFSPMQNKRCNSNLMKQNNIYIQCFEENM